MTILLAAPLVLLAASGLASAHDEGPAGDHGDLSAFPQPDRCAVHVQASGVDAGGAFIEITDVPEDALLTRVFATGSPTSPPAREREFAYNESIHLTAEEASRAGRVRLIFYETTEEGERVRHSAAARLAPSLCDASSETTPPCPPNVRVEATQTSGEPLNVVEADPVESADGHRVYRDDGTGWELLVQQQSRFGVRYVDGQYAGIEVEPGETYRYRVTSFNSAGESEDCEVVQATAVPFFGAPLLGAVATAGGVGAYAFFRRR